MPLWITVSAVVAGLLSLWARVAQRAVARRFGEVQASSGAGAHQVARLVLQASSITDVTVEAGEARGDGHYDPGARVVVLDPELYERRDLAAIGVAAHCAGLAIQHSRRSGWWALSSVTVPLAAPGGALAWALVVAGVVLGRAGLAAGGLAGFVALVLLQILALPAGIDASRQAAEGLGGGAVVRDASEDEALKTVLTATALIPLGAVWSWFAWPAWRPGRRAGGRR